MQDPFGNERFGLRLKTKVDRAQADLRKVLAATGGRVVEGEVPIGHAHTRFDEHSRLNDPALQGQLEAVLKDFVEEVSPVKLAA